MERTQIGFYLPKADQATLTLHDMRGRVLKVIRADYDRGYHQLEIKRSELPTTGVLYYTLETGDYAATKKMVIVE